MTAKADRENTGSGCGADATGDAVIAAVAASMPVLDSRKLFGSAQEIGILHQGSLYRLKITRQGKLILNK